MKAGNITLSLIRGEVGTAGEASTVDKVDFLDLGPRYPDSNVSVEAVDNMLGVRFKEEDLVVLPSTCSMGYS